MNNTTHCSGGGHGGDHGGHTGHDTHGHDHGGSGAHACKMKMLWNWDTIDSCFLGSSWHVTSVGMFAASCIAVIVLSALLVLLRRLSSIYDQYLTHRHQTQQQQHHTSDNDHSGGTGVRPSLVKQLLRACFFATQSFLGLIVMLLAMTYNGYVIISIIIGYFLGFLAFEWRKIETGATAGAHSSSGLEMTQASHECC